MTGFGSIPHVTMLSQLSGETSSSAAPLFAADEFGQPAFQRDVCLARGRLPTQPRTYPAPARRLASQSSRSRAGPPAQLAEQRQVRGIDPTRRLVLDLNQCGSALCF